MGRGKKAEKYNIKSLYALQYTPKPAEIQALPLFFGNSADAPILPGNAAASGRRSVSLYHF